MKKFLSMALAIIMMLTVATSISSCGAKQSNVKVYTEYELTAEEYAFAIAKENTELMEAANALLAELKENVIATVLRACGELRGGKADAAPCEEKACEYCKMKAVCRIKRK